MEFVSPKVFLKGLSKILESLESYVVFLASNQLRNAFVSLSNLLFVSFYFATIKLGLVDRLA